MWNYRGKNAEGYNSENTCACPDFIHAIAVNHQPGQQIVEEGNYYSVITIISSS